MRENEKFSDQSVGLQIILISLQIIIILQQYWLIWTFAYISYNFSLLMDIYNIMFMY